MGIRISDKTKIKQNRGKGEFEKYTPWIYPYEFGSEGRGHKIKGWLNNRMYSFLSDLECCFFINSQWDNTVVDIREQYPLPLYDTIEIARSLGIIHPPRYRKEKSIMTTDFLILRKVENDYKFSAIAIKPYDKLQERRILEKLTIEKLYWEKLNVPWSIVTEKNINIERAKNLWTIYSSFFWADENNLSEDEIFELYNLFKTCMGNCVSLLSAKILFEKELNWDPGAGIDFIKYLIVTKRIECNLDNPVLSFTDLIFTFKE